MQLEASVLTLKSLEFITVKVTTDFNVPFTDEEFSFDDSLVGFAIKHGHEDDGSWWVAVGFRNSNEEAEKQCPYLIDMHAVGKFSLFEEGLEDQKKNKIIFESGGSIVYGAIRDMVTNITMRGIRGGLMMPTPMFAGSYERHLEEIAKEKPKKKVSKKSK